MLRRTLIALALFATLGSCSSAYDVRAVIIGGGLAFVPAETDMWGEPDCIYSIRVSAADGPGPVASAADDARMVANGITSIHWPGYTAMSTVPAELYIGADAPPGRGDQ